MMGRTHAATGAILAVGVQPALAHFGLVANDAGTQVVAALLAAGAGLYADLDHPDGTISHTLPPVTTLLSRLVGWVSGGHRNGTHSILGIAVATAIAWGVSLLHGWPVGLWLGFTVAIGLTGLRIARPNATGARLALVVGTVLVFTAGGAVWTGWFDPRLLPWMTLIGMVAHILGDLFTKEGCPLLWPWGYRMRLASITTESWVERYVVAWVLFAAAAAVLLGRTGYLGEVVAWVGRVTGWAR